MYLNNYTLIERTWYLMSIFKLAYLNVIRRPSQSLLTGMITTLTIFTFVLFFSIFFIVQDGLNITAGRLGADIVVLPNTTNVDSSEILFTGNPQTIYMPKDIESKLQAIDGVEKTTSQFFTTTIEGASCCAPGEPLRLVGIDLKSDFILKPWFDEYGINSLANDEVIIGSDILMRPGDKTYLLGDIFEVIEALHPTGTGMDNTIFLNIDKTRSLSEQNFSHEFWVEKKANDSVSSILLEVSPGMDVQTIVDRINNENLACTATSTSDSVSDIKEKMNSISKIIFLVWLALLTTSSLALIGRFNSLVKERKKEIGFLRAMGVQKKDIFKLIISEAWIIAGISGLIGSILGVFFVKPILSILNNAIIVTQGRWSLPIIIAHIFIGLISSLLLGFLASVYPAWKSSSLVPQEAISKGAL